jgi:hypothetical protein
MNNKDDFLGTFQGKGVFAVLFHPSLYSKTAGGVALVFAPLASYGKLKIRNIGQIEWGCENVQGRLLSLGAHIERVRE